ncbi:hypothetical protein JCM11491_007212 [Sporobolomyces phaffii]
MSHRAQQPSTASASYDYYASPNGPAPQFDSPYAYTYDAYDHDEDEDDRTAAQTSTPSHPQAPRRNDSIFSISSSLAARSTAHPPSTRRASTGRDDDVVEGGAFQGEEYRHDPFATTTTGGRRNKRYGLSDTDTYDTSGQYSSDDDDDDDLSDLEVFNARDSLTSASPPRAGPPTSTTPKLGGASRRHARFEALTNQELAWMGISAACVVGLTTGAVVVAFIG